VPCPGTCCPTSPPCYHSGPLGLTSLQCSFVTTSNDWRQATIGPSMSSHITTHKSWWPQLCPSCCPYKMCSYLWIRFSLKNSY
jgi:hypothetical protein